MANLTELMLYRGNTAREVTPSYGFGDDRHDYGRGFYLTEDVQLAQKRFLEQWMLYIPSREMAKRFPLASLKAAYLGLHDLELDLAVQKAAGKG